MENLTKPLSTEGFTGQNKLPVEHCCDFCGYCGTSSAQSTYLSLIKEIKVQHVLQYFAATSHFNAGRR